MRCGHVCRRVPGHAGLDAKIESSAVGDTVFLKEFRVGEDLAFE
jgi:hypothetical protein